MNRATLAIIGTVVLIVLATFTAIFLARGYRFDIINKSVQPTGILVTTSDPDGAGIWIDGKLKTATNNTINLDPGTYQVRIHKEGFSDWEKKITIRKEEVFKTNAFLFPSLVDLRPLTFSGAVNPVLSLDHTKIVYGVASASARLDGTNPNGLWILDMGRNLPVSLLNGGDLRQIYAQKNLVGKNLLWSPDEKEILAGNYLLETDKINLDHIFIASLSATLDTWQDQKTLRQNAQLAKMPLKIPAELKFSPDGTKVLYTATVSATLAKYLTTYLPGTNPTPEIRTLTTGNTYVYDLKEDRNYEIQNSKLPGPTGAGKNQNLSWFPSSRHLLSVTENQISVMEFDGTNQSIIFSGQFDPKAVFVWPNWSKIVILTPLGSPQGQENLYTINLR